MSVWIYVGPEDWQRPQGDAPAAGLVMQASAVRRVDTAEAGWVEVYGYHHRRVEDEMPELVTYLVRWEALPAEAQALLKAADREAADAGS